MFRFVVLLLLGFAAGISAAEKSYTALKFAHDKSSYISYSPDMTPLTDKFSVCLWVRKLQSGNSPCPFAYKGMEIFMTDNGYYTRVFKSNSLDIVLTSKFTTPRGEWFLYCSTWSLASRTFTVYVNGQLAGSQTTPSGRKLQTGGALTLGNYSPGNGHHFGGELYNLNMFSKELTAAEVATLSSRGFCADIPEQLEQYRVIRWEDILKLSRSGTVQDVNTTNTVCAAEILNKTHTELLLKVQGLYNATQEELKVVRGELDDTKSELEDTKSVLEDTKSELDDTKSELEDTKSELEDTKLELQNDTESKCALKKGNLTKWDIFYSPQYYNKPFTRRLYQQLRTTWDSINSRLFGMTITNKVIELIKDLDDDQIERCGEL